ncbi:hypothetical protein A2164_04250 [Candidatus Curtissbacteria bacterium RBG_13_35_7]|uniref:YdbS-like PH domain-containing protein n=1 Tax=Candidatus Curtissbacteria bacterium RBG_13_35_7 TaxID=1797705 RepID=A0A1F5G5C1_9BACT|nr:MAG: hypothetical protein A2164_04250 [Candidatus Curtissbacteria bacterium RBG_13_35_7]
MKYKPPTKHQKKRFAKYLSQGEQLIFATGIGKRYFWIYLFFLLIMPLILTYVGIFMFAGIIEILAFPWLKFIFIPALLLLIYNTPKYSHLLRMRQSLNYLLTNRRFLIVSGIFTRKIVTAPLTRITHVTVEQSFFQRFLFDSGNILIITAGFDQREIVIDQIGCPIQFKILVEELTDKIEESSEKDDEPNVFKLRALKD